MELFETFPDAVIANILSRIPVKILLQYRCVCKAWHALIRSPFFTSKHLNHFNRLARDSNCAQILLSWYNCNENKLFVSSISPQTLDVSISVHMRVLNVTTHIRGACNGLLCICGCEDNASLWNFATKEFKILPPSQVPRPPDTTDSYFQDYGFGFDPNTNDYKVVRRSKNYRPDHSHRLQIELYSLNADSWKALNANLTIETIYPTVSNTWLNGAHHWWAIGDCGYLILSFDMTTEVYSQMPLPGHIAPWDLTLGVLALVSECLSLIVYPQQEADPRIDVWVMNDYGVENSWAKLFTVEPNLRIEKPLGLWKNGELFYESRDGQLAMYDPRTQMARNIHVCSTTKMEVLHFVIYTDSLVRIKGKRGRVLTLRET